MKITLGPSTRGSFIGVVVAVILLLLALFMIIYLLLALLRVPIRSFPTEDEALYWPWLYESIEDTKWAEPDAPPGMRFSSAPLLASTNLVTWEVVHCRVDKKGLLHAPDGAVLQLRGEWSDEWSQWTALSPVVVRGGTNAVMMFRVP